MPPVAVPLGGDRLLAAYFGIPSPPPPLLAPVTSRPPLRVPCRHPQRNLASPVQITGDSKALEKELSELFRVNHNDERERADLMFEVSDSDVGVEKYVSPEEEERLRREAEAEAARQAKAAGDGSVQRALTMMMGGTLERPDNVAAEFAVERPAWLDTDPKTWSEEQFKESKEYEMRQKAAAEEMAKKIQTVETELRTLKVAPAPR